VWISLVSNGSSPFARNPRTTKQTAEQAYLSFMAGKDYQLKDGKVFFRTQTAAQSEQYRALMQRIEDSTDEMGAFRQQSLSEVKKKVEKFGQ